MLGAQQRGWSRAVPGASAFVRRFGKFAVVGASGTAIHLSVFWWLTSQLDLHYLLAGAIGIEAGLCSNYILNNNWTFADRRAGFVSLSGLSRYHAVSLGGMLINLAVLQVLAGMAGVRPSIANLAGMPLATAWNYSLNAWWTWQGVKPWT